MLFLHDLSQSCHATKWNSGRGWENKGQDGYGRRERNGGGGSSEKVGKGGIRGGEITQQGLLFRSRKSAKGRKPRKKVREPVIQGK